MRRNAALLGLLVFGAALGTRLAAAASADTAATTCALACARAGMAAEKGAACCPMGHGAALPTLSSCAHDGDAVPLPAALPMLLCAGLLLTLPALSGRHALVLDSVLPLPPALIPDKVPLLG
ncbi:MAG TPA: hypothetical protein VMH79_12505 [Thermoanaerobaculia bacterium]|nr:hypothetical protein [Thermoanaerobaculia bacterium]